MTYTFQPTNPSPLEVLRSPLFAPAVLEVLRNQASGKYFSPNSIPQRAVDLPVVRDLPVSPQEGDEVFFLHIAHWHLRFAGGFWFPVGGATPLRARVDTQETTTSTTYGDLSGGATGPEVILPGNVVGTWDVEWGGSASNNTAQGLCFMTTQTADLAASDTNAGLHSGSANSFANLVGEARTTTTVPGDSVIAKYRVADGGGGAGTGSFLRRWLRVTPTALQRAH